MSSSPAPIPEVPKKPDEPIGTLRSLINFPVAQLEPMAKALVAFVAGVYALGLLVTNRYLISFGISDFSSLRPRYVFTGTWALWLIIIGAVPAIALFQPPNGWQNLFRNIVAGLMMTAALLFLTLPALDLSLFDPRVWVRFSFIVLEELIVAGSFSQFANEQKIPLMQLFRAGLVIGFGFTVVTVISTKPLYGSIPEGLGGGKPMTATVIFDPQGVSVWEQAGMPFAAGTKRNSQKVKIIYEDEHNLYVEGLYGDPKKASAKMVIVSRSLVNLILPEDFGRQ